MNFDSDALTRDPQRKYLGAVFPDSLGDPYFSIRINQKYDASATTCAADLGSHTALAGS